MPLKIALNKSCFFIDDDFWTFRMVEDRKIDCINLGSYNYLGFAENNGPCTEQAIETCHKYGLSACSSRHEVGTLAIHKQVGIFKLRRLYH